MTPKQYLELFAIFADVAPDVFDAFMERHPELRSPPKPDEQKNIWNDFTGKLDKKFPEEK